MKITILNLFLSFLILCEGAENVGGKLVWITEFSCPSKNYNIIYFDKLVLFQKTKMISGVTSIESNYKITLDNLPKINYLVRLANSLGKSGLAKSVDNGGDWDCIIFQPSIASYNLDPSRSKKIGSLIKAIEGLIADNKIRTSPLMGKVYPPLEINFE